MKRKACVALAVTGDTRLVILDEPTTGLDPGARRYESESILTELSLVRILYIECWCEST